jgi:hypothetical protein
VAELKSLSQAFGAPTAPEKARHVFSRFARALIFGAGDLPVAGNAMPGDFPVAGSARLAAVANAFANPFAFVDEAPTAPPGAINCESDHTAATVVTSFIVNDTVVLVDSWLQAPMMVKSAISAFDEVAPT